MRNFRRFPLVILCLGFTGGGVAWADPAHAEYIEDPYAPHATNGTTARLGTSVGFIYGERQDVTAVGGTVAGGQRWGRLALEAEYSFLAFQEFGASSVRVGRGQRLGVVARFDVLRVGSQYIGANSLLALYLEGGAGVAWNAWFRPRADEANRIVPEDTKRPEGQVGLGLSIDHRLQEPISFPRRIGWFLGWRMALAPHETEAASVCRGVACSPAPMMPETRYTDRSMLFQSSMFFTW
ncbi:MAG: hypothetical protein H0T79_05845 [Deltaproteobacteria bacterium]|nr:hypothetical protein [Deltaproteobacteria bacterium]